MLANSKENLVRLTCKPEAEKKLYLVIFYFYELTIFVSLSNFGLVGGIISQSHEKDHKFEKIPRPGVY